MNKHYKQKALFSLKKEEDPKKGSKMNSRNDSSEKDLMQTEKERDFTGVWIPREIYLRKDLSWSEKILLIEIDSFSKNEEGCFASNEYFAQFLGIHAVNISKMISKLKDLRLIEQVKYDGRRRFLKSCPQNFYINTKSDLAKTLSLSKQKDKVCISKNAKSLYIRNINTSLPIKNTQSASPSARDLCVFLLQKIKEINPRFKQPDLESWESEVEKMLYEDGRTPKEIREVIEWAFNHEDAFWKTTFLSPSSVRKLFDKAVMRMKTSNKNIDPDLIAERKAKASSLENEFNALPEKQKRGRKIDAYQEGILFIAGGQSSKNDFHIEYTDSKFKEKLKKQLENWGLIGLA